MHMDTLPCHVYVESFSRRGSMFCRATLVCVYGCVRMFFPITTQSQHNHNNTTKINTNTTIIESPNDTGHILIVTQVTTDNTTDQDQDQDQR
jgi:hypothetical protein